jgi:hypothetical protein
LLNKKADDDIVIGFFIFHDFIWSSLNRALLVKKGNGPAMLVRKGNGPAMLVKKGNRPALLVKKGDNLPKA